MQQTEKYKLNLIESSDPFLPDGLNQNTLKLEEVVSQHLEGMDRRVTVLEAHKVVCGSYIGTRTSSGNQKQVVPVGFRPLGGIVFYTSASANYVKFAFGDTGDSSVQIVDDGLYVSAELNTIGGRYVFLAFC